jgi:transcriptional regulator with XRE-family HTH domain
MKDELSFTISADERTARRRQLYESLKDKSYREDFVQQQIETGLPFQIKGMRKARGWKQSKLGTLLGKPQSVVSRLENPDYGKFNLQTLRELATVFDVGLLVAFVPFSHLANRVASFSVTDVEIPEFDKDPGFSPSATATTSNVSKLFARREMTAAPRLREDHTAVTNSPVEQTALPLPQWRQSDYTDGATYAQKKA